MPTLGEILGGIVRDVVHARLLADRLAYDSAKAYAADPLLAVFPVPRVGIKEVAVKLSFAISELEEKDVRREAEAEARELWKRELASEILPRLVTDKADPSAIRRATEALAGARTPDFGVAAALAGNPSRIVRDSTSFIAAQIAGLPADVRRKLGNIRAAAARELPAAAESFVFRARQLVDARAAARTYLQVLVRKAELEKASPQTIHEFTFTLALDDAQVTGPVSAIPKQES